MKINFDYYFEENTICNIFYSRRIKFECGGREKILKLAFVNIRNFGSLSLEINGNMYNSIDDITKILKITEEQLVETIYSHLTYGDVITYKNKLLVSCGEIYKIESILNKKFNYNFIFNYEKYSFELGRFYIGNIRAYMKNIFDLYGINYVEFAKDVFEKNGFKAPELIKFNTEEEYSFKSKDDALIFTILAENELKDKIEKYMMIEKLGG